MSRLAPCVGVLACLAACGVVNDVGPTLSVSKTGDGTVTSSPDGIDCGTSCAHPFALSSTVALTATAGADTFFGWTGGTCAGLGDCLVDMTADTTIQAMFGAGFVVDVTLSGDGTGGVTSSPPGIDCGTRCAAAFSPDSMVTLTASPTSNSSFVGWSGGGCSGVGPCTTTVSAAVSVTAAFSRPGQTFTTSGTFLVPTGVTTLRVLVVGGGGGGADGHQGGGGAGHVATGSVAVTEGSMIVVTVGAKGLGAAADLTGTNIIAGNTVGGDSSFGSALTASGGLTPTLVNQPGAAGGSGGGGSCNSGTPGGAGGSGGANGGACTYVGGVGQGSYVAALAMFTLHAVTAGAGGAGGTSSHSAGGGAGGIVLAGTGPNGSDGAQTYSAKGGIGFGAGGGGGGYNSPNTIRDAGGDGAPGVVYVEW